MTTPKLGMAGTISRNVGTFENPTWEYLGVPFDVVKADALSNNYCSSATLAINGHMTTAFRAEWGPSPILAFWRIAYAGFMAGLNGLPRDWSEPAIWHMGYLHGRMKRYRDTGKMYL